MIQQNYKVINNIQLFFQYFYILEWNVLISDTCFFSSVFIYIKKQKQSENDI